MSMQPHTPWHVTSDVKAFYPRFSFFFSLTLRFTNWKGEQPTWSQLTASLSTDIFRGEGFKEDVRVKEGVRLFDERTRRVPDARWMGKFTVTRSRSKMWWEDTVYPLPGNVDIRSDEILDLCLTVLRGPLKVTNLGIAGTANAHHKIKR